MCMCILDAQMYEMCVCTCVHVMCVYENVVGHEKNESMRFL